MQMTLLNLFYKTPSYFTTKKTNTQKHNIIIQTPTEKHFIHLRKLTWIPKIGMFEMRYIVKTHHFWYLLC